MLTQCGLPAHRLSSSVHTRHAYLRMSSKFMRDKHLHHYNIVHTTIKAIAPPPARISLARTCITRYTRPFSLRTDDIPYRSFVWATHTNAIVSSGSSLVPRVSHHARLVVRLECTHSVYDCFVTRVADTRVCTL